MRIAILCIPVALAACAAQSPSPAAPSPAAPSPAAPPPAAQPIGMPNPAARYCVEQGGRSEIRREPQGETGYCHLPDGRVVDEWQLFREAHKDND